MRPRFLTGDMVEAASPDGGVVQGIVLCVLQSNPVPDARARGLQDFQPWSYYVLTSERCNVLGPLSVDRVKPR